MVSRRNLIEWTCGTLGAHAFSATFTSRAAAASQIIAPTRIDPMSLVDKEMRPQLEQLLRSIPEGLFNLNAENLITRRTMSAAQFMQPRLPAPTVAERSIPTIAGSAAVRVFVIGDIAAGGHKPAILHMHGGGYVSSRLEADIGRLQRIAAAHNCLIVTVDYRLAPETRFPGALEDNYAALMWLHAKAHSLGVDISRIAVMGESAGGGHAAQLALAVRDRREFKLALQVLIYPMLDDRTGSSRQPSPNIGQFLWTSSSNAFGWTSYLGVPAGSETVPAGAVPARVTDLRGLAPAWIGVGSIDLFVEEDIEYARRLIAAGVPTELLVVPGAYHGFDGLAPFAKGSQRFTAAWNTALTRAFTESMN